MRDGVYKLRNSRSRYARDYMDLQTTRRESLTKMLHSLRRRNCVNFGQHNYLLASGNFLREVLQFSVYRIKEDLQVGLLALLSELC
jgi:hypothetical protein